jgi:radical SAM protein with 4Fe4S-binding SPASM domain
MLDVKLKLKPGHKDGRDWMAPSPLRVVFWNATYACNFGCGICFSDSGEPSADELTTREAKDMLRRIAAAGVKDVVVSGGEPFMRKDMFELLVHMAELGISARIASNGSLLTDDLLRRLRKETLTRSFMISLDSVDPAVYREIHRASDEMLAIALQALRHIQEHGFHTTVAARVTPRTLPGLPDLVRRAAAEDWATLTLFLPLHVGRVEEAWPKDADILSRIESLFDVFFALPKHWLVQTCIPWARHHPVVEALQKRADLSYMGCGAGRSSLVIQPPGRVCPCFCMDVPEGRIGDVRRDDIATVFRDSSLCDMMRRPKEHGICQDCEHVGECGGGCRAAAFAMTGRLDGPDLSCPVRRRKQASGASAHAVA